MLRSSSRPADPIDELRLRSWARRNYVPIWERDAAWNPVVLEEMEARDQELSAMDPLDVLASMIVPLEPDTLQILHPAHAELPQPNILRERNTAPAYVEQYYF